MKKKVFIIFRLVATFAIFFALFKIVPYEKLVQVYKNSRKAYLFLGLLTFFTSYFIGVNRWRFLLSSLGIRASLWEVFSSSSSGLFFNIFFPSFIAGDVFRGFSISHRYGGIKKVASSVLMDRFSGGLALTVISFLALVFSGTFLREKTVILAVAVLCAGSIFGIFVIFSRKFFHFLSKAFTRFPLFRDKLVAFHDQLYFFKKKPKIFVISMVFSFVIQTLTAVAFFTVSKAFYLDISIINFFILVPIIMAISLIPLTPVGAGTREASAVYFFSLIGVDKTVGLGISFVSLISIIIPRQFWLYHTSNLSMPTCYFIFTNIQTSYILFCIYFISKTYTNNNICLCGFTCLTTFHHIKC